MIRLSSITTPVAWLAVVAAAVTCVVLMVRLVQRGGAPTGSVDVRPIMPQPDTAEAPTAEPHRWSPESLLQGRVLSGAVLVPPGARSMDELPGSLTQPTGAQLLGAWRSRAGGLVSETAVLSLRGVTIDRAADQLAQSADQADFEKVAVAADQPDRRTLVYHKAGRDLLIRLRAGERVVRVVVMIRYTNAQPD